MQKRCQHDNCRKVLQISAFPCKCDKTFCSIHRAHYDHSCTFNYMDDNKKELLKVYSTAITAQKFERIN